MSSSLAMHRRSRLAFLCYFVVVIPACGDDGASSPEPAAELPPIGAPLTTLCERTGSDWLDLPATFPGRWHYGSEGYGQYTEVESDLRGAWGMYEDTGDRIEGRSVWSFDEDGLVVETGDGPCSEGSDCGLRFVQSGTVVSDATRMAFYALWPVDPCQSGIAGVYEGREFYENNTQTGGELRLWSERSERLTLSANGTWHWWGENRLYANVSDMGMVFWDEDPPTSSGDDSGTYEVLGDSIRFTRDDPEDASSVWVWSQTREPVDVPMIGRAVGKYSVALYERMTP